MFAVFFPTTHRQHVRFVVNPLAPAFGGPAWDFLWIIPSPRTSATYRLTMRVILREYNGMERLLAAYHEYRSTV